LFTYSVLFSYLFFFECSSDHRDIPSFPTRRSSDLGMFGAGSGNEYHAIKIRVAVDLGLEIRFVGEECFPVPEDYPAGMFGIAAEIGEHTSELQSRENLVCRLLLEKKKK